MIHEEFQIHRQGVHYQIAAALPSYRYTGNNRTQYMHGVSEHTMLVLNIQIYRAARMGDDT